MTELSFLVDLLLNHKLPKATKDAIAERIKTVESQFVAPVNVQHGVQPAFRTVQPVPPALANQCPSTQAALARHPDLMAQMQASPPRPDEQALPDARKAHDPAPVAVVAQTAATAAAMASRAQAIAESIAGKTDKLTGRPRKF